MWLWELFSERYLGLPIVEGRSKYSSFKAIKERVWNKNQVWKERLLTEVGKEILIKAVAQAIIMYSMNCFLLPYNLCKDLMKCLARFWWGSSMDERKVHWLSCERLTLPKKLGGMSCHDLHNFNLALLAKQCWRIMGMEQSLLFQVLKARYFPNCSILQVGRGFNSSFTCRWIYTGLWWSLVT